MRIAVRLMLSATMVTMALLANSTTPSETLSGPAQLCSDVTTSCPSFPIFVNPFDPALGTLDALEWSLTGSQDVEISIENCPISGPPPLLWYSYNITTAITIFGSSSTYTGTGSGDNYGGCAGYGGTSYLASFQMQGTITTDLSQFIGTGTNGPFIPITSSFESVTASTNGNGTGGTSVSIANQDATLTVSYDYTPAVPEPSTLALMCVGFLGVLAKSLSRRRGSA
jgi:hypothetical protein